MPFDSLTILGVSIGLLSALLTAGVYLRCRSREQMLRAVVESFEQPLLFYNEYARLVFYSRGLVLFSRQSLTSIQHPPVSADGSRTYIGEITIDYNRYRYRSKALEYKPGVVGTLVYLDYLGSQTAT